MLISAFSGGHLHQISVKMCQGVLKLTQRTWWYVVYYLFCTGSRCWRLGNHFRVYDIASIYYHNINVNAATLVYNKIGHCTASDLSRVGCARIIACHNPTPYVCRLVQPNSTHIQCTLNGSMMTLGDAHTTSSEICLRHYKIFSSHDEIG